MSEMIERVAKALYEDQCIQHPDSKDAKDKFYKDGIYHHAARVAIRAMREPTEAMLLAGGTEMPSPNDWVEKDAFKDVWQKAIDAALAETIS